ncbi:Hsp20/alpha crystallin family protein [Catenuloplanes atrovinosus]|uniref:HSP20 family molecular chaperone IbpA n=1 Tax=Catenuloplanes atrovinosus TaxID=137266 RepID=A0AAE3YL30_9ACTN|nr:Hsp20/alpha crystallin family protein [Catenuloplanes atrovinosus]MDR7274897.1 HSP20 family molecular chaperone IbpA [Catenuloplanes atrovinosus]
MSNTLWTRRDPFAEFDALVRNAFSPVATSRPAGFTPAAEVLRDGDDAVVRLELPGVDAENDVAVEVDGGRLTVRGERRDERAEQRDGRSLREVRYGAFRRSFGLPAHVTSEAVSATYDAGVLSVRVAGAYAGREARRIPVTAGAAATPVAAVEAAPEDRAA